MSVSSISQSMGALHLNGAGPQEGMKRAMGQVADLLGMTGDELKQKVQSGSSIADIASEKGISRDDAVSALAAGLKANAPQGISIPDDRATQMAQRMVDGPPAGMTPIGGGQGMPAVGSMSRLAEAFAGAGDSGAGGSDLLSRLMAGEDPSSVASSVGRSSTDLMKLLSDVLKVDDRA
jgi:hypothetical protein